MPNHLAKETSPYLLQHVDNPVDWYPWGPEALQRAQQEDKPIFLSIGYSACHWCHVMAHESFEDEALAAKLNEHFINIKVDREERPDLDQIYMNAVQMLTGRGGWPMSMFLTPDLKPFYGGTYWPPTARLGMPGFDQVIQAVADAWKDRRQAALEQADQLTSALQHSLTASGPETELSLDRLHVATAALERIFDHSHGGFGGAPKFPHPMDLRVLLRAWHREPRDGILKMVTLTLDKMAAGGIYDHLGGGFHRYSVDERWLVPHFEKMLYDNALLAGCYLEGYQATGNAQYAQVVRETLDYVLREMTDEKGGFYSTQDADSEGEEGKFYVWTPAEVETVLGADAARAFCYVYDVSPTGNFEGKNILNRPKTLHQCAQIMQREEADLAAELEVSRQKLYAARQQRIAPGLDDKVLVGWNGLMIDSLALAAGVLDEPRYLDAATRAADFLLTNLRREDGRLLHTWRHGEAKLDAYLDDYACLVQALITLYEASFAERWIDEAVQLAQIILDQFNDGPQGGFFYTASDHERLIARNKDVLDSSVPSGNSMATTALLRLGKLTGNANFSAAAEASLVACAGLMDRSASAMGQLLLALDGYLGPMPEIVVLGDRKQGETAEAIADLRRRFIPNRVIAYRGPVADSEHRSPALTELFIGKVEQGKGPTVYVCENFTCKAPINGLAAARSAWDKLSPAVR